MVQYDVNLKQDELYVLRAFEEELKQALDDRLIRDKVRWFAKLDPERRTVLVLENEDGHALALLTAAHIVEPRRRSVLVDDLRRGGEYPVPLTPRITAELKSSDKKTLVLSILGERWLLRLHRRDFATDSRFAAFGSSQNAARELEFFLPHFETLEWRRVNVSSERWDQADDTVLVSTDREFEVQLVALGGELSEDELRARFQAFMSQTVEPRLRNQLAPDYPRVAL